MNEIREALYWKAGENGGVRCELCPNYCHVAENSAGICGVRENLNGKLIASGYGHVSSESLDPIEKKPLYMFHPGKLIYSIGGFGCNLKCPFCQNYEISTKTLQDDPLDKSFIDKRKMTDKRTSRLHSGFTPNEILRLAEQAETYGNIGVAYTYNEPLIGYEFLYDCAALARDIGLENVIVTNGYINKEPLENLLPLIDAMNIDLKGFTGDFYKKLGGRLETVKETIMISHKYCHIEVTTLVIPEENEDDIEGIAKWLSSIDPDIPLHLSRFFPRYQYSGRMPTPRKTINRLCEVAKGYLKNVFAGNM
jgi:pyruvate formate lyase activating enzyme